MSKAIFITGTGTDVGKTVLSLALLLWAKSRGLTSFYYKPVQCGEPGDDAWIAARFPGPLATRVTSRFPDAVSPHLAAERAGAPVDGEKIRGELRALKDACDLLVVEGAGGAAVPLDREGRTLAALAAAEKIPCLVAAAPGLGTLHHTLSTLAWLRGIGASPAGFAFCQREPDASALAADNAVTLELLGGLPFFGVLPHLPGLRSPAPRGNAQAESARASQGAAGGSPLGEDEAESLRAPLRPALDRWWAAA